VPFRGIVPPRIVLCGNMFTDPSLSLDWFSTARRRACGATSGLGLTQNAPYETGITYGSTSTLVMRSTRLAIISPGVYALALEDVEDMGKASRQISAEEEQWCGHGRRKPEAIHQPDCHTSTRCCPKASSENKCLVITFPVHADRAAARIMTLPRANWCLSRRHPSRVKT
jgi:hypothetical protein